MTFTTGMIEMGATAEPPILIAAVDQLDTGTQATFAAQPAGTLLLGWLHGDLSNDPTPTPPDELGWTEVGDYWPSGMFVWAKVADGTETSLTFNYGTFRETSLYVLALSATWVDGPHAESLSATLDTMTSVGPVNYRLDFVIGGFAPGVAPTTGPPGVFLAGQNGQAGQRANSLWYVPLGSLPPGSSVPGLTYSPFIVAVSLLVNIT